MKEKIPSSPGKCRSTQLATAAHSQLIISIRALQKSLQSLPSGSHVVTFPFPFTLPALADFST